MRDRSGNPAKVAEIRGLERLQAMSVRKVLPPAELQRIARQRRLMKVFMSVVRGSVMKEVRRWHAQIKKRIKKF